MELIGIFGDSFGVRKDYSEFSSWITLLGHHYSIINYCECGVGEYKILQQLRNSNLDKFDHIIVTHTSATRVYVKNNPIHASSKYHKNCDIIYADVENRPDEFSVACQLHFKYIFDIDYAISIHNMICEQIDNLLADRKVTHITHFDYTGLYNFNNMINFYELFLKNKGNVNHYNQIGNINIYQTLIKQLCLK